MKTSNYIPAKLLALLFGLYMLAFSIMPADYVFVADALGLSADASTTCDLISNIDGSCADTCADDHDGEDDNEGTKLPPFVEEEDIFAHQPVSPALFTPVQTVYFHSVHSKWCDNISTIATPPPDRLCA